MHKKMLTCVHYDETLCYWLFETKGEVVELLEKGKREEKENRTLCSLEPNPEEEWVQLWPNSKQAE